MSTIISFKDTRKDKAKEIGIIYGFLAFLGMILLQLEASKALLWSSVFGFIVYLIKR